MDRVFSSLGAFAEHMRMLYVKERAADIAGRGAVAETLSHLSQDMLGKASLFKPLAPSTVAERRRLGYAPYETLLRSGDLRKSISWAHTGSRESGVGSSSPYAIYHVLGGKVPGRPPVRDFLTTPVQQKNLVLFELYGKTYRLTLPL